MRTPSHDKKTILIVLILLFGFGISYSQQSLCISDFDFLVKKVKSCYPGYADKIKGDKVQELAKFEQYLRGRIAL